MRSITLFIAIYFLVFTPDRVAAQCAPEWSNPFVTPLGKPIFNTGVNFDPDGEGPLQTLAVFAGRFVIADGTTHDGVAGWDGTEWTPLGPSFVLATAESFLTSAVVDDDGPGPHPPTLWMGGNFANFAGVPTRGIVRYSGGVWSASGADDVSVVYRMIALDEDGSGPQFPRLCIQATFPGTGDRIAILDDDHWEMLGGGPASGSILGLLAADLDGDGPLPTRPVVVGDFSSFSESDVHHVAVWTGSAWESVGGGTDGNISAATMHDPDGPSPRSSELFVVGQFGHAGGVATNGIARFQDGTWHPVDNPLALPGSGLLYMTCVVSADDDGAGPRQPTLVIAGTGPGSSPLYRVFRGDGETVWEEIGSDLGKWWSPPVSGRVVDVNSGGRRAQHVFTGDLMWDGQVWTRLASRQSKIFDMKSFDLDGAGPLGQTLVVGGQELALTNPYTNDCVTQWDGTRWLPVGGRNISGTVNALAQYDLDGDGPMPPRLLAAGRIKFAGSDYGIVALDENGWSPFANSVFASPNAQSISKMEVFDVDGPGGATPLVIVSGQLSNFAEPSDLSRSAMWNGVAWSQIGTLTSVNMFDAFHVHDVDGPGPARPALFAGLGSPNNFFPTPTTSMLRWDGTTWSEVPDVQTGEVMTNSRFVSMCSLKGADGAVSLCAGAVGPPYARQLKNGQWSNMGTNLGPHTIGSLTAHDDGTSQTPHETAYFTGSIGSISGSTASKYVGQWDGSQWIPMGSGLSGPGRVITSVDFDGPGGEPAELFVTGNFTKAGGMLVDNLAEWRIASPRFPTSPWSRTVVANSRVSLKLPTTGQLPLTYQWRRDGQPIVDGGGVSGATTRELIIESAQFSDSGIYDCVVTNTCGSKTCPPAIVRVCPALPVPDVNHDGAVNGLDISPFVEAWQAGSPDGVCSADLNANGAVDAEDLQWFIQWLVAP